MSRARRLLVPAQLTAYIRTLHPEVKRKVRAALDTLVANPFSGKLLRGRLVGLWSIRVGRLRVIYREAGDTIQLVALGPRRTVYEEAERLARKRPDD